MGRQTRYFAFAIFLVLAALCGGYIGGLFALNDRVVSPHIEPRLNFSSPLVATHSFPFEESTVTVSVPINSSVYLGAQLADKSVSIYGNVSHDIWLSDSYRSMIQDPSQDEMYKELAGEFRKIKDDQNLSDDEYLELLTVYVQSLRYETTPENPAKFPVETVMDGTGDCDDKSLLLAGLLSHEGYNVTLFAFGPETHMAIGVGSDDYPYKNTGYSFVETTNYSFVGVPTTELAGGLALNSDPTVIPVGNGLKIYHSGGETRYIENCYDLSERKVLEMEPGVKARESGLQAKHTHIDNLEKRMNQMKTTGDVSAYNEQVLLHNDLITNYNSDLAAYHQSFKQYQTYAEVHNFILMNGFNRKGVFDYVKKNLPQ
jgi:hypothetical protein